MVDLESFVEFHIFDLYLIVDCDFVVGHGGGDGGDGRCRRRCRSGGFILFCFIFLGGLLNVRCLQLTREKRSKGYHEKDQKKKAGES